MVAAIVCREMKWTWGEFNSQPYWFIAVVLGLMSEEASAKRRNAK